MQAIVDTKGHIISSRSNSSKRYDSICKKLINWGRKRVHLTKTAIEYWIYKDTINYPEIIIKEVILKYKIKMKYDLKEEIKDERKLMHAKALKIKLRRTTCLFIKKVKK